MLLTKQDRIGYDYIIDLIPNGAAVLDLGCGDGLLLERLQKEKSVEGSGVEISESGVTMCIERGLYCLQGDIDDGLSDYKSNSFDYVILNQTIQSTKRPFFVINEVMRIGKKAIISFPNFGYFPTRLHLLFSGTMPKTKSFPYEWYESPNIHVTTINDFRSFCHKHGYPIACEGHFLVSSSGTHRRFKIGRNAWSQYGFFILDGMDFG
jgi:methionine biosynthesis protein MetW